MMPEAGIRALLIADEALSVIVGNRVHVNDVPLQSKRPAIVIRRVSTLPTQQVTGTSLLTRTTLQIGARSERIVEAAQMSERVRQILEGYRGTTAGQQIQSVKWINRVTAWDPTLDTHAVDDDFAVWTAA